ncbi:MAG: ATP-binding cassette subfamily B protein [Natronomonas sp.]|jgi:ATP-binding cassette subfamily B protein
MVGPPTEIDRIQTVTRCGLPLFDTGRWIEQRPTMSDVRSPVGYLLDRFAVPRWRSFAAGAGLLSAATVLQRVPALVIGVTLDALLLETKAYALPLVPARVIPTTTSGQAVFTVGVLGAAILGESACRWYGNLVYDRVSFRTLHDLRTVAFSTAVSLPVAFHDDTDSGDVLSIVNDDVDNVGDLFAGLRDGLGYAGGLVSAFALMMLLNWNLALLLLAVPVVLVVTGRLYARLLQPRYDAVRESIGRVNVRVRDAIQGLSTVKAFTGEPTERSRVAATSNAYRNSKWSAIRLRIAYDAGSWTLGTVGIWGLFLLGGYWVLAGPPLFFTADLTAGGLLTFLIYAQSFLDPTRRLAVNVIDKIESARSSARRVVGLLREEEMDDPADDANISVTDGRVEYDGVGFSYDADDGETLTDVSFTAEGGEFVGVVGSTGAGKSTLLKLLFRFYDPDTGTIRVDGQDISAVLPSRLREHLGYVSQDPFLFPGTVAENVAFGESDPDREAVIEAARVAGADEFVTELPDGYDTRVGERGASLSGGQRQRLAIARAVYADPEILVFDEATSHVDTETEAAIQRSLHAIAGDSTVFAIAHRLSTVRDADRILVLEDGAVVERGTHADLLASDGTYADLWRVQTGAVAADDAGRASAEVGR